MLCMHCQQTAQAGVQITINHMNGILYGRYVICSRCMRVIQEEHETAYPTIPFYVPLPPPDGYLQQWIQVGLNYFDHTAS